MKTAATATPVRVAMDEKSTNNKCWKGQGEKEAPYTVGEQVNWCCHSEEQCGGSLKN